MRFSIKQGCAGHSRARAKSAQRGQSTVEGAFLIPILLVLLLLLIQPSIFLYDRMVMQAAAAEGCRALATQSPSSPGGIKPYEDYILRRLGSIPQQDNFHVHSTGCSWRIEMTGNEASEQVSVSITNELKPLPLFDVGAEALGLTNGNGNFELTVEVSTPAKSAWVLSNEDGMDPKGWVNQWE